MKNTLLIFGLLWALGASGQIYINSYAFGAAPSANLLLDDYPNAAAAYSLRKLRTAYTGDCIVVRRASNNDTLAIGFSGNYLDTAALKTFCSGTDCFVRRWYDQSANGRNLEQTTNITQPRIVSSGAISRGTNGNVGLIAGRMQIPSSTSTFAFLHNSPNSIAIVAQIGTSSNPNALYGIIGNNGLTANNPGINLMYDDRSSDSRNNTYLYFNVNTSTNTTLNLKQNEILPNSIKLIYMDNDPATATLANRNLGYIDANSVINNNTQSATPTNANANFNLEIMSSGNSSFAMVGLYHELVIWNTSQSTNRTAIQSNINSFYTIY